MKQTYASLKTSKNFSDLDFKVFYTKKLVLKQLVCFKIVCFKQLFSMAQESQPLSFFNIAFTYLTYIFITYLSYFHRILELQGLKVFKSLFFRIFRVILFRLSY